jgi:hypothetical protein
VDPSPAADLLKAAAKGDADALKFIQDLRNDQRRIDLHLIVQGYIRLAGAIVLSVGTMVVTVELAQMGHPIPAALSGLAGLGGGGYALKRAPESQSKKPAKKARQG